MDSQEDLNRCTRLCAEDFEKARMALEKANVAGPIRIIVNTDEWSPKQWKLYEMMEEMANAPKEPVGERQPRERGMYEIQRKEIYEKRLQETNTRTERNINDVGCS